MIEKDIIQDQKETIHRLQEECKEKTDIIMALGQKNEELSIRVANLNERIINGFNYNEHRYKQALEEIREIAGWHTTNGDSCDVQDDMESIINIINEVLND